jgi:beta-lactamase regulating signal transducer with metallopeptidase domain
MNLFDTLSRFDWIAGLEFAGDVAVALWAQSALLLLAALVWRAVVREPAARVWIARGTLGGLALLPVLLLAPGWPRWEFARWEGEPVEPTPVVNRAVDEGLSTEPVRRTSSPSVPEDRDGPEVHRTTSDSSPTVVDSESLDLPVPALPQEFLLKTAKEPRATLPDPEPLAVPSITPPAPGVAGVGAALGETPEINARPSLRGFPSVQPRPPVVLAQPKIVSTWNRSHVIGGAWLVLGACVSVWLLAGWCVVWLRVWRSRVAGETLQRDLREVAGGCRVPRLRLGRFWRMPGAVGWWRPVIVLPETADLDGEASGAMLSPSAVRGAIAHELAHIRAGDLWLMALERALLPLYVAQPALWLLRKRLRDDQELLADARAAAGDRVGYAESLLEWVKASGAVRRSRDWRMPLLHGVSMSESSGSLARRMEMLLDPNKSVQPRASRRWVWLVLLGAVGGVGGIAAIETVNSGKLGQARNWLADRLATPGHTTPTSVVYVDSSDGRASEAAPRIVRVVTDDLVGLTQVEPNGSKQDDLSFVQEPLASGVQSFNSIPVGSKDPISQAPRRWLLRCVIGSINEDQVEHATGRQKGLLPGMESRTLPRTLPRGDGPFLTDELVTPKGSDESTAELRETWLTASEVQLRLDLAKEAGLVKVLAEPTLVAETGKPASFHAGGELPVVQVRERINGRTAPANISMERFGLSLELTPVLKAEPQKGLFRHVRSFRVRISQSELTRPEDAQAPVIDRRTLELTTSEWSPGRGVILVEQELNPPALDLSRWPDKAVGEGTEAPSTPKRPERTFAVILAELADPATPVFDPLAAPPAPAATTVPPTDPVADLNLELPSVTPPPRIPQPTPPAPSVPVAGGNELPSAADPLVAPTVPVAANPLDPNVTTLVIPGQPVPADTTPAAPKTHTIVQVELLHLDIAKRVASSGGPIVPKHLDQQLEDFGAKLEARMTQPISGEKLHVAVKMHQRELARLRSLLETPPPAGTGGPDARMPWITTVDRYRFVAEPGRRRLAATEWGIPTKNGWSMLIEATATATRGIQSDGAEGVTHFDIDARMASFDLVEAEMRQPDLETMRIVRHRLKQPDLARFQVRIAPREVAAFTYIDAETRSPLVAIVSCSVSDRLPDWADPNQNKADTDNSYHPDHPRWCPGKAGTTVEPAEVTMKGTGVNSDAGLTGNVTLTPAAPTALEPDKPAPTVAPGTVQAVALQELKFRAAAVKLGAAYRDLEHKQKLKDKGVITTLEYESALTTCKLAEIEAETEQLLLQSVKSDAAARLKALQEKEQAAADKVALSEKEHQRVKTLHEQGLASQADVEIKARESEAARVIHRQYRDALEALQPKPAADADGVKSDSPPPAAKPDPATETPPPLSSPEPPAPPAQEPTTTEPTPDPTR